MAGIKYEFILKMVQERAKKRGGGKKKKSESWGKLLILCCQNKKMYEQIREKVFDKLRNEEWKFWK